MRIALITPEYPGCGPSFGVGRYIADLAHGLAAAGHAVLVIAATDVGCFTCVPGEAPSRRAPAHPHLLFRPLTARRFIDRALGTFEPDVIETPNWGGLAACLDSRAPLLVRLMTSAIDPSFGSWGLRTPLRWASEAATVRRADFVVANSTGMATFGARIYNRIPDAITHLAYAGDLLALDRQRRPDALFVGRLERRKGIDVLLQAWATVHLQMPEARLHVVGRDMADFTAAVQRTPGAVACGQLDGPELDLLRSTCRIQVIPSRSESFGLVALEAWANGLAVVASRAGGLAEVVADGGLLVPPADAPALSEALVAAMHPEEAWRLANAGRDRLLAHFLPDPWIDTTIAQYRGIAGQSRH